MVCLHLSYSQLQAVWEGRNNVLQKTSRHVVKKTRKTLLYSHGMDKMLAKFCYHSISNYVHKRNKIGIRKTNFRREPDPGMAAAEGQTPREELWTLCV